MQNPLLLFDSLGVLGALGGSIRRYLNILVG
jgi:hypothetical protein